MQIYHIKTTSDGEELTQHGTQDYPCAFYDERFSAFVGGEVPWHWHEEFEVVLVVQGAMRAESVEGADRFDVGEGLFINSGALHRMTRVGRRDCRILNVVFKSQLIAGDSVGRIHQRYVYPIVENKGLVFYPFSHTRAWHQTFVQELRQAFSEWQRDAPGFELAMQQALLGFWRQWYRHEPQLFSPAPQRLRPKVRQLQAALTCIHDGFASPLSVGEVARAAMISESECYRLFKSALGCTPMAYLLQYRLRQAAALLLRTHLQVAEVAYRCGFNCPAYFAKKFRETHRQTPSQYRVCQGRAPN